MPPLLHYKCFGSVCVQNNIFLDVCFGPVSLKEVVSLDFLLQVFSLSMKQLLQVLLVEDTLIAIVFLIFHGVIHFLNRQPGVRTPGVTTKLMQVRKILKT